MVRNFCLLTYFGVISVPPETFFISAGTPNNTSRPGDKNSTKKNLACYWYAFNSFLTYDYKNKRKLLVAKNKQIKKIILTARKICK